MKRLTKYHIASIVFMLAIVLGTAVTAEAREAGLWETFCQMVDIVIMMCAVRHPLGHASLFDWTAPATNAALLSVVQWAGIGIAGAVAYAWKGRRP